MTFHRGKIFAEKDGDVLVHHPNTSDAADMIGGSVLNDVPSSAQPSIASIEKAAKAKTLDMVSFCLTGCQPTTVQYRD